MTAAPNLELRLAHSAPTPGDVYRDYGGYVAALGHKLLGRDSEVDDLVQDVFLAAIDALPRLRDPATIKGWLATLTVRQVGRRLRRRRLASFFGFDASDPDHDVAAPGASPEDRALLGQVYVTLDGIPVADRLAWTLRHLEGEPLDTVATLCDCSLATAKRRIAAAQSILERTFAHESL